MNYTFYYSKDFENELREVMDFLKVNRGIRRFPDIPAQEVRTLAWHNGKEICFKRIGLRVGQLIINKYDQYGHLIESRPLYPYIMYEDGESEDKIILDESTKKSYEREQKEVRNKFCTEVREGIVPFQ